MRMIRIHLTDTNGNYGDYWVKEGSKVGDLVGFNVNTDIASADTELKGEDEVCITAAFPGFHTDPPTPEWIEASRVYLQELEEKKR